MGFSFWETTMIDQIFASFDGAFSDNTVRAYRSDWMHYESWCNANGMQIMPAIAENLAAYIKDMAIISYSPLPPSASLVVQLAISPEFMSDWAV